MPSRARSESRKCGYARERKLMIIIIANTNVPCNRVVVTKTLNRAKFAHIGRFSSLSFDCCSLAGRMRTRPVGPERCVCVGKACKKEEPAGRTCYVAPRGNNAPPSYHYRKLSPVYLERALLRDSRSSPRSPRERRRERARAAAA